MNIPAEFAQEFATFPAALRALVEAELASGNTIATIAHGFPAAPCGASIKLTNAVGESRRKSEGEVSFYERNNSSHAGEFTTEKGHFFVLEPPLPEPTPPDMDEIRKSLQTSHPNTDEIPETDQSKPEPRKKSAKRETRSHRLNADKSPAARKFINTETPTGWTRELDFRHQRAPREVQFALERALMILFVARMDEEKLLLNAEADINGANYKFELRFVAALRQYNYFTLRIVANWGDSVTHRDYFRKTSDSWFKGWICDLEPAKLPASKANREEQYRALSEAVLNAERHLNSVAAVQNAILEGMKRGGTFGTSHKEGGSNIYWRVDRFVRSDYGDSPDHKNFTTEAEFLKMLWNFCQFDVTRSTGKRALSELDAWKLILRRMSPATSSPGN